MIASTGGVVASVATMGLALGASPFGIIGVILLLGTGRPLRNALSFTTGWMTSIAIIGLAAATVLPASVNSSAPASTGTVIAQLVVGGVLLVLGAVLWRRRSQPPRKPGEPAWMRKTQAMGPVLAFLLGAFLPTYALIFPAVERIQQAGLPPGQAAAAFAVFVVLATTGLIVPIVIYLRRPGSSAATLERWRVWLLANRRGAGAVAVLLIGMILTVRGVGGLV